VRPAIDLYLFVERNVFETDAAWLDALAELAGMDVPGLALQVRTKTEAPERAIVLAREARALTRDALAPVLLNGTTAEAVELGYAGVHWPEALIPDGRAPLTLTLSPGGRGDRKRRRVETETRGASVHSVEACARAEAAGADFVVAGTIFDAGSKPVAGEGLAKLRRIAQATRLPVLAIGGVRPDRVAACVEAGAAGVAVVTSVLRAPDMPAAVRELREALDEARKAAKGTGAALSTPPSPVSLRGEGEQVGSPRGSH
jgi:thiamine monophosphate synthase